MLSTRMAVALIGLACGMVCGTAWAQPENRREGDRARPRMQERDEGARREEGGQARKRERRGDEGPRAQGGEGQRRHVRPGVRRFLQNHPGLRQQLKQRMQDRRGGMGQGHGGERFAGPRGPQGPGPFQQGPGQFRGGAERFRQGPGQNFDGRPPMAQDIRPGRPGMNPQGGMPRGERRGPQGGQNLQGPRMRGGVGQNPFQGPGPGGPRLRRGGQGENPFGQPGPQGPGMRGGDEGGNPFGPQGGERARRPRQNPFGQMDQRPIEERRERPARDEGPVRDED